MRAAAESGASVIAIEKMTKESFFALGLDVGHINSKFLESFGVPKADPIELFNDWMLRCDNRANPSLVMKFCKSCGDAFDWYTEVTKPEEREQMFVRYWPVHRDNPMRASGYKFWPGTAVFPGFFEKGKYSLTDCILENLDYAVEKFGAEVHFGIAAEQLIKQDGRVTGVIAKNKEGGYVKYNARKGIVLATGGFSANKDMTDDLLTDITDLFTEEDQKIRSMSGRDGRGIQMAVWAGGRMEARPIASMGGNNITPMGPTKTFGILWLNENGKRYSNEVFGDPVMAGYPGAQDNTSVVYNICDSSFEESAKQASPSHGGYWYNEETLNETRENMRKAAESGREGFDILRGNKLYAGDTYEQLAENLSLSGEVRENFIRSIERYNELCKQGRDEDFGKDLNLMIALDHPPYYAQILRPYSIGMIMDTVGGLLTDENQNVLDDNKDAIPGLIATGNCCGRRFGVQYSTPISGVSIGMAITLGREAGKYAAGL